MSSSDFLLVIDGIDGESQDDKIKNAIEVDSFSFGTSNTGTMSAGTGGGSGKVNMQDFHFTKKWDKSSSNLFVYCSSGEHIPTVTLHCRKATGKDGGQDVFLEVKMSDCVISSYNAGGSDGGSPVPTESVSFNFTKIEFSYRAQNTKGGGLAGPVKGGWDQKSNKRV